MQRIKYCWHEWWPKPWRKQESTPLKFNIDAESDAFFESRDTFSKAHHFVNIHCRRITSHSPKTNHLPPCHPCEFSGGVSISILLFLAWTRRFVIKLKPIKTTRTAAIHHHNNNYHNHNYQKKQGKQQQQQQSQQSQQPQQPQRQQRQQQQQPSSFKGRFKEISKQRIIWPKLSGSNAIGPCEAFLNTLTTSLANILHFLFLPRFRMSFLLL